MGVPRLQAHELAGLWRERLAGSEPVALPLDFPRGLGGGTGSRPSVVVAALPLAPAQLQSVLQRVQKQQQQQHAEGGGPPATLPQLLLALLALALLRWSEQLQLSIGCHVGRRLGVVQLQLKREWSLLQLLGHVRERVEQLPRLEKTQKKGRAQKEDGGGSDNRQEQEPKSPPPSPTERCSPQLLFRAEVEAASAAESWCYSEGEAELGLRLQAGAAVIHCSGALFSTSSVQRMAGHIATLAESAADSTNTGTPLGRLPMLTPAEEQLLVRWNETTQPDFPPPRRLEVELHEPLVRRGGGPQGGGAEQQNNTQLYSNF